MPKKNAAKPNKSDFIRKHPAAKAAEVVRLGKEAGITFAAEYVYSIRQAAKRAAKAGRVPGKAGRPHPGRRAVPDREAAAYKAVWNVVYMFGVEPVKALIDRIEHELAAKTRR